MKKLPKLEITEETPAWQAECLSKWLVEWRIHSILGEIEDDPEADENDNVQGRLDVVDAFEPDIADGQIRLLAPRAPAAFARPIYLAVLECAGPGQRLCVPFGQFSEPALPGEWKTARQTAALSVSCVWNSFVLSENELENSWSVGQLEDAELTALNAVRAFLEEGKSLSPEIERDTGPPVIHPIDPRRDYRDAELAWVELLEEDAGSSLLVRDPGDKGSWSAGDRELLLAAEGRAPYGRVHRYSVVGYSLSLVVAENSRAQSMRIDVVDAGGGPSRRLDGGYLLGIDGGRSVPVWMGRTRCDRSLLERGFILFDDRGQAMPTSPVE